MKLGVLIQRLLGRSDILIAGDIYMRRWRLIRPTKRTGGVRVHQIVRGDADRECHCHPFWFLSFIFRGGYIEHRIDGTSRRFTAPAILFRNAHELHRLELIDGQPAWTFVIVGRLQRGWGFLTRDQGWIPWEKFVERKKLETGRANTATGSESNPFLAKSGY